MMRKRSDSNGGDGWGILAVVVIFISMFVMFYLATKDYRPIVQALPQDIKIMPQQGEAMPGLLICFEKQYGCILWKLNVSAKNGVYASQISINGMDAERDMVVGLIDVGDGNKLVSLYHLSGNHLISQGCLNDAERREHLQGDVLKAVDIFLHTKP